MLVVNGREAACEVPVADWFQHGMTFRGLGKRPKTTKVVLHWTGGLRDATGLYDTLLSEGLSVHFCVDVNGKVRQYCDADLWCSHAGRLDDGVTSASIDTVGVEIVNHASDKQLGKVERPIVTDRIHGRDVVHAEFLPEQIASALALARALCAAYKLPYVVPTRMGELITTSMLRGPWERFRGVVGHYHARRTKNDPGLGILRLVGMPAAQNSLG